MQEPEQPQNEPQQQAPQSDEHRPSDKWQNRICNALTLVGLLAIVVIGGSSILADVEKKIAEPAPVVDDATTTTQETFEPLAPEPLPLPEPIVEEEDVDTLAVDTALTLEPEVELPADTAVSHHTVPAVHHDERAVPTSHPADSIAH